eukprot:g75370.t1
MPGQVVSKVRLQYVTNEGPDKERYRTQQRKVIFLLADSLAGQQGKAVALPEVFFFCVVEKNLFNLLPSTNQLDLFLPISV